MGRRRLAGMDMLWGWKPAGGSLNNKIVKLGGRPSEDSMLGKEAST